MTLGCHSGYQTDRIFASHRDGHFGIQKLHQTREKRTKLEKNAKNRKQETEVVETGNGNGTIQSGSSS